jgi:hypothetical protein
MASIRDDPYMKFPGGFITYKGKGVPGLIKDKMERGLENVDKCLERDECKVRIHKEYFLPADLGKLDALTNWYLKSWLGMPQGGYFLPVHSGLGMDVKSVSHLYKKCQSLDIVRAMIRGNHTVETVVQAKVHWSIGAEMDEKICHLCPCRRKCWDYCHQWNLQLAMLLMLNPLGQPRPNKMDPSTLKWDQYKKYTTFIIFSPLFRKPDFLIYLYKMGHAGPLHTPSNGRIEKRLSKDLFNVSKVFCFASYIFVS